MPLVRVLKVQERGRRKCCDNAKTLISNGNKGNNQSTTRQGNEINTFTPSRYTTYLFTVLLLRDDYTFDCETSAHIRRKLVRKTSLRRRLVIELSLTRRRLAIYYEHEKSYIYRFSSNSVWTRVKINAATWTTLKRKLSLTAQNHFVPVKITTRKRSTGRRDHTTTDISTIVHQSVTSTSARNDATNSTIRT